LKKIPLIRVSKGKLGADKSNLMGAFASVWWLNQNGLPHVVGTMGSDCSEKQAELIVSLVKPSGRVWIAPDGDKPATHVLL
jgi:DNA primase